MSQHSPGRSRSPQSRVCITGLGAVSPIGIGVPAFTAALRAGTSGVRLLPDDMPGIGRIRSSVAATCPEFDPASVMDEADLRRLPRLIPMALAAAREAMSNAGLFPQTTDDATEAKKVQPNCQSLNIDSESIGLILGTGAGGIDFTLDQALHAYGPDADPSSLRGISLWTITNATHGNLAGELSIRLGLRGPSLCMSTGCASSSDAMGYALELLRSERPGAPSAMVIIGADAHVRWETLAGMELLKVISITDYRNNCRMPASASRPFDVKRDGFVLGEGAWAVVLERECVVHKRGVKPIGELMGYGATCDAFHRVRPNPDMAESARAMRSACDDASLNMQDVQFFHYHGTSTRLNDESESRAVKLAFGESHAHRLIGHSVKSMIGHPQGASGAASVVATLASLTNADSDRRGPFSLPTINLDEPDVAGGCDLEYTPFSPRPVDPQDNSTFMVNCLAFGAKNSALVMRTTPVRA